MKIKRFFAKDMRTALNQVKEELGNDAVIMSNKKMAGGVEIVAAVDNDAQAPAAKPEAPIAQAPKQAVNSAPEAPMDAPQIADSLAALLERQQTGAAKPKAQPTASSQQASPAKAPASSSAFSKMMQGDFTAPEADLAQTSLNNERLESAATATPKHTEAHNPVQSAEIATMREEMASIRQLLEHQVSGLMDQDLARRDPTRAFVLERLQGMGVSKTMAEQVVRYLPDDGSTKQAWQAGMAMLGRQLNTTQNEILRLGGVYAMVGPTGVGKTTTVAKLAALGAQKFGKENVALISTDTYRIGALEQLATYGRIIGCPVKQAKDSDELAELLYVLRNKKLVLIDTAGMSQRDLRLNQQLNTLVRNARVDIRSYLVLSATSQREVLEETVRQFQKVELSGCIFTKLDECLSLGEIVSVAIQNRLPLGYLTNGQRVPEDIRVANAEKLIKKAEQLYLKRANALQSRHRAVASHSVGMYD